MGDQLNLVKISDYIQSKNYNIDDRIISLLGTIEFDNSHNSRDLNYSAGRMYLKARDKRALDHLLNAADHFEVNKVIIEINMMIGVYYLREKNYEMADRYFMACYPLMPDDFEFDGENWPWSREEVSSLDINDRIDLYTFLTPYFEHIDIKIYFESLLFQLRCNETVQLLRTGHHKKALIHFDALFDSMPYLNMDMIEQLRIEFREKRKHDLRVQIFDMATLFHYQAIAHWSLSNNKIAKYIFHESMDYREYKSHYLDLSGTYSNIAMVNNNLGLYEDAVKYYEKSIELVSKFGEEVDLQLNLLNLSKTFQLLFDFDKALITAKRADQVNKKYNDSDIPTKIKISQQLGKVYIYLGEYDNSIAIFEKCYMLKKSIKDPNIISDIIFNLIFLYNRMKQNNKSRELLNEFELLSNKNLNNHIMLEYYVSKMDFNYFNQIKDSKLYKQIFRLIIYNKIDNTLFETAVLQLIRMDRSLNNFVIDKIFMKNIEFSNKIIKLSNQSINYHMKLMQLLPITNIEKLMQLKEKLKMDLSLHHNIKLKKIKNKLLNSFDFMSIAKIIDILITYNLDFRYYELNIK